jgi:hypothetical protein
VLDQFFFGSYLGDQFAPGKLFEQGVFAKGHDEGLQSFALVSRNKKGRTYSKNQELQARATVKCACIY